MREILFRGKRIDSGEWAYGDLLTCDDEMEIYSESHGENGGWVIPETVGEYTGVTDKNGVKIFEGDVLESFLGAQKIISVVKYGAFRPDFFYSCAEECGYDLKEKIFGLYTLDNFGKELMFVETMVKAQVIGNIHDNPELVKE